MHKDIFLVESENIELASNKEVDNINDLDKENILVGKKDLKIINDNSYSWYTESHMNALFPITYDSLTGNIRLHNGSEPGDILFFDGKNWVIKNLNKILPLYRSHFISVPNLKEIDSSLEKEGIFLLNKEDNLFYIFQMKGEVGQWTAVLKVE